MKIACIVFIGNGTDAGYWFLQQTHCFFHNSTWQCSHIYFCKVVAFGFSILFTSIWAPLSLFLAHLLSVHGLIRWFTRNFHQISHRIQITWATTINNKNPNQFSSTTFSVGSPFHGFRTHGAKKKWFSRFNICCVQLLDTQPTKKKIIYLTVLTSRSSPVCAVWVPCSDIIMLNAYSCLFLLRNDWIRQHTDNVSLATAQWQKKIAFDCRHTLNLQQRKKKKLVGNK